jgi:hypothetical protein
MRKEEMNQSVTDDLNHIPYIKGYLAQNLFRSGYNAIRRHDLAQNPATPPSLSFGKVLKEVRKTNPSFIPIYDRDFFQDV